AGRGVEGIADRYVNILMGAVSARMAIFPECRLAVGLPRISSLQAFQRPMHDDFPPRHADLDTHIEGAALVVMAMGRLDGHPATGNSIANQIELGDALANVFLDGRGRRDVVKRDSQRMDHAVFPPDAENSRIRRGKTHAIRIPGRVAIFRDDGAEIRLEVLQLWEGRSRKFPGVPIAAGFPARSMSVNFMSRVCFLRGMNLAVKLVQVRESRFMSINKRLRELFEEAGISYEVYNRPLAFTREAGAGQRSSGDHAAQVVILNVDGKLAMAVVAANQRVHLATAGASLGARQIRLASEEEFLSRFPDYAIEAMPPFG